MEQTSKTDLSENISEIPYITASRKRGEESKQENEILLSDNLALDDKFPLPLHSPLRSQLQRSAMPGCPGCGQPSPYKCSTCDQPYCSVACYRKHNEGSCSEEFNKLQVMNALKGKKASQDVRQKTMETLLKHRENDEKQSSLDPEDAERLLRDTRVWLENDQAMLLLEKLQTGCLDPTQLSPEQMKMFDEFLKSEAKNTLGEQTPLWEIEDGAHEIGIEVVPESVEDLSKVDDSEEPKIDLDELFEKEHYDLEEDLNIGELRKSRNRLRRRVRELPALNLLRKMTPDKQLSMFYNVVNSVYSICYIFRQFNGDLKNNTNDICRLIYYLAPCVRNDWRQFYASAREACRSDLLVKVVGLNNSWIAHSLVDDLEKAMGNKFLICEQLYLVYDCFQRELEKLDTDSLKSDKVKQSKNQLNSTLQKLIFFMTLTRDIAPESIEAARKEIQDLIKESQALAEVKAGVL